MFLKHLQQAKHIEQLIHHPKLIEEKIDFIKEADNKLWNLYDDLTKVEIGKLDKQWFKYFKKLRSLLEISEIINHTGLYKIKNKDNRSKHKLKLIDQYIKFKRH